MLISTIKVSQVIHFLFYRRQKGVDISFGSYLKRKLTRSLYWIQTTTHSRLVKNINEIYHIDLSSSSCRFLLIWFGTGDWNHNGYLHHLINNSKHPDIGKNPLLGHPTTVSISLHRSIRWLNLSTMVIVYDIRTLSVGPHEKFPLRHNYLT